MEGIFKKKYLLDILFLFLGASSIGLYLFIASVDTQTAHEIIIFIILSILLCSISIIDICLKHNTYLRINDHHLSARYHFYKKIECDLSEIEFASSAFGILTLYLKNGTSYTVTGLENGHLISSFILKNIDVAFDQPLDDLFRELSILKNKHKRILPYFFIFISLWILFFIIFINLTGDKEFYEFTRRDWTNISIFGILIIFNFLPFFYISILVKNKTRCIERLKYKIQWTAIKFTPLPDGNIIHVFTDSAYSFRLCFIRVPDCQRFYYTLEKFDKSLSLIKKYISEVYKKKDDFLIVLEKDPESFPFDPNPDKLIEIALH